ncbi:hypothetical protein, partial [Oceanithermus sp.]|uniref:hypothetical protein n=1 Tax=Oceanithermus sp. TaxID=2268145 RepID=UPI0025E47182
IMGVEVTMTGDLWEAQLQEVRRKVGRALGYEPGLTLELPFGAVELRLPGGRRRLRGCLRTGLWRVVEDAVALTEEAPLETLLERLAGAGRGREVHG